MPFQPVDYASIKPQGNPAFRDLVDNLVQGYQAGQLPAQMSRQAEKERLANAFQLMLNQEQPEKFRADQANTWSNVGLNNANINKINTMTPLEALKYKIENAKSQSDLDTLNQFRNLLREGMTGNSNQGNNENINQNTNKNLSYTPIRNGSLNNSFTNPESTNNKQSFPKNMSSNDSTGSNNSIVLSPGNPNLSRLDQIYENNPQYRGLFEKMGFKGSREVKFNPATGQVFSQTTLPSGRVELNQLQIGSTPEEISKEKEIGKIDADSYKQAIEGVQNSTNMLSNLDYVNSKIQNNPEFGNVVGPINSVLTKYFGSPEDRELLGNIMTGGGNVVLDAAKSIKGAFTSRDQNLISSIKFNPNDTGDVFIGKINAMRTLGNAVLKRNSLIADYIKSGMSTTQAIQKASKETDISSIEKDISLLQMGSNLPQLVSDQVKLNSFTNKKDAINFLSSLPTGRREALKKYSLGNK